MPKPVAKKSYTCLVSTLMQSCKQTAEVPMLEAAHELSVQSEHGDNVVDTSVSCDGSWQRRGFSSLNGFVSAISMDSGKIVDIEPMSRYCRQCVTNETLRTQT